MATVRTISKNNITENTDKWISEKVGEGLYKISSTKVGQKTTVRYAQREVNISQYYLKLPEILSEIEVDFILSTNLKELPVDASLYIEYNSRNSDILDKVEKITLDSLKDKIYHEELTNLQNSYTNEELKKISNISEFIAPYNWELVPIVDTIVHKDYTISVARGQRVFLFSIV